METACAAYLPKRGGPRAKHCKLLGALRSPLQLASGVGGGVTGARLKVQFPKKSGLIQPFWTLQLGSEHLVTDQVGAPVGGQSAEFCIA